MSLCQPSSPRSDTLELSQTRSQVLRFGGTKLIFLWKKKFFIKKFLGTTKFGGAEKNFGELPRIPPVAVATGLSYVATGLEAL